MNDQAQKQFMKMNDKNQNKKRKNEKKRKGSNQKLDQQFLLENGLN